MKSCFKKISLLSLLLFSQSVIKANDSFDELNELLQEDTDLSQLRISNCQLLKKVCDTFDKVSDINATVTGSLLDKVCDINATVTGVLLDKVCWIKDSIKCDVLIGQDDIPYTINSPGTYCLKESISYTGPSAAIIIESDCVNLCLNGHAMDSDFLGNARAVLVSGGYDNIIISGGSIKKFRGGGVLSNGNGSISDNIIVRNMMFENNLRSIEFDNNAGGLDLNHFIIEDCVVDGSTDFSGIEIHGSHGRVSNCTMSGGIIALGGISGTLADHLLIENCIIASESAFNKRIQIILAEHGHVRDCIVQGGNISFNTNNIQNLIMENCYAKNPATQFVFSHEATTIDLRSARFENCHVDGANGNEEAFLMQALTPGMMLENIEYKNCSAQNTSLGFRVRLRDALAKNICFTDCVVQNVVGFGYTLETLFGSTSGSFKNILYKNCKAQDCGADGFTSVLRGNAETISQLVYDHCLSQGNETSTYVGVFYNGDGFGCGGRSSAGSYVDVVLQGCVAQENQGDGFALQNNVKNVIVDQCKAVDNAEYGFEMRITATQLKFINSCAQGNELDGFVSLALSVDSVLFKECTAEANAGNGFNLSAGGGSTTTTHTKLIDCCAISNGAVGFRDLNNAPMTNRYLGNTATNNPGGNYVGAGIDATLIVTGAAAIAAASRWNNVDY